jgi:molecular chaperone GrpE (heat shock protein)
LAKTISSKKKIRIISELAVLVGLVGIVISFATADAQSEKLNAQIADYQQKHGNMDQFIGGQISFKKFVNDFDDRDVQAILNKEGQNFVVQQWALTSSLIVTAVGSVVLSWFAIGWFLSSFSANKMSKHFVAFCVSLPLISKFTRKRVSGLCWTSSDTLIHKTTDTVHHENGHNEGAVDPVKSLDAVGKTLRKDQNLRPVSQPSAQNTSATVSTTKQQVTTVDLPTPVIEEPISVLKDLSEHVSAIREYATLQQGRMEKLQDGYDWNIIRNFCLRIIRCIDNLDARIIALSTEGSDVSNLEEVRDELIFSLESSGVESFEPQLNTDYHSQEKMLEAIKDKVPTDDAGVHGKVAKVVRCGYHYLIEDDTVKVIRPCQVSLFG